MVIRDKQDIMNSWIMKIVFLVQSIRDDMRHVTFCCPPKLFKKIARLQSLDHICN